MICPDCHNARTAQWPQYNTLACKYCAARLIYEIGKLRTPTSEQVTARRRVVLAEAIAWGWDEAEIRALVKGGRALEPVKAKG